MSEYTYDTDADGWLDAEGYDANEDGLLDAVGYDANEDGLLESAALDANFDTVTESYAYDTDGDGAYDSLSVDTDADGWLDTTVPVTTAAPATTTATFPPTEMTVGPFDASDDPTLALIEAAQNPNLSPDEAELLVETAMEIQDSQDDIIDTILDSGDDDDDD